MQGSNPKGVMLHDKQGICKAHQSRRSNDSAVDVTTKAAPMVKRYVHEKFGVRRVKMDDIKVVKHGGRYTVTYHKHAAQLH